MASNGANDNIASSMAAAAFPEDCELCETSHEDLMALKYKKNIINSATEQFNAKPSKAVAYMQEMKVSNGLSSNNVEVVQIMQMIDLE